ncbi:hypothetical protein [Corynebacterium senegalense]|uniref:hypothetical protein n=1 Tax=Corynebacterium senegalense TaxID=2080750 RepID=UPI0011C06234|nr:hypothetical protein [Corynebacterium senegalense]
MGVEKRKTRGHRPVRRHRAVLHLLRILRRLGELRQAQRARGRGRRGARPAAHSAYTGCAPLSFGLAVAVIGLLGAILVNGVPALTGMQLPDLQKAMADLLP